MTAADILLIGAIAVFALTWWVRGVPSRGKVLLVSASVALAAGVWGVVDDRWQAGVGVVAGVIYLLAVAIGPIRNSGKRVRPRPDLPFRAACAMAD